MYQTLARISRRLPRSRNKVRAMKLLARIIPPRCNATVRMRDGTLVVLDPRSRTEGEPFWDGVFDEQTVGVLAACLTFGPVAYDVGANVGLVALPLARHAARISGGRVVAFEPVPSNAQRIRDGIVLNALESVLRLFPTALGDSEGRIEMAVEARHGATTGNAMMRPDTPGDAALRKVSATVSRLDDLVEREQLPAPDVMKLDVEGAEPLVLAGAAATITRHRPIILGEFHSKLMPSFGKTFAEIGGEFLARDYRIYAFTRDFRLARITEPKAGQGNVLLVPEGKAEKLESLFAELDRKSPT